MCHIPAYPRWTPSMPDVATIDSAQAPPSGRKPARPDSGGPIIVYDGFCGMCSLVVRFALWADGERARLRFAPAQSTAGAALYETLPSGFGPDETFLHVADGIVLTKGKAVRALLNGLGPPWRLLARAMSLLPIRWIDRGYDIVARNRYWIWGRQESCRRPPPGTEARFLA
ncbi:thiol-disulfide oxidoreductase DCC family protein [Methylobacterium durans]|uniref:thiol-disulfide oxidoreductase DCC family protein n=1 Tax=Methylobacterium durans TaxID=2202825 RepID=UPI003C6D0A6A